MKNGPQKYPGASTSAWYQGKYGGDSMESNVVVWHTTEGTGLPTYSGGAEAPNFTAAPDFKNKKLKWYQHFDFDTSSRALVNKSGGVETNTLNVVQIELIGTCDPSTHKRWGATPHLYTPELPDWAIRDLAAFAKWAHDNHGVPLTSGVTFRAYPSSYGATSVRMSASKWNSFRGHCGHQHVPENDHGDPGAFPIDAILKQAAGTATAPTSSSKEDTDVTDLNEQVPLPAWAKKQWPDDKGVADGKMGLGNLLGSLYSHARLARENTDELVTTVDKLTAAIDRLTAAVTKQ